MGVVVGKANLKNNCKDKLMVLHVNQGTAGFLLWVSRAMPMHSYCRSVSNVHV